MRVSLWLAGIAATVSMELPAVQAAAAPVSVQQSRSTAASSAIQAADLLESAYVFPEIGARYAAALRAKEGAGGYAGLDDQALAAAITQDLQAVSPDRHLKVFTPRPAQAGGAGAYPPSIAAMRMLDTGTAYLSFNYFSGEAADKAALEKFLDDHRNAKALIIDLRPCRGGGLEMIDMMLDRFYAAPTEIARLEARRAGVAALGQFDLGKTNLVEEGSDAQTIRYVSRTTPSVMPMTKTRIFVLISSNTNSAAEHLAFALKRTGRATLVGQTTRGADHFGGPADIAGGRLAVWIPIGRTFDPVTGEDWDGKGVAPDVPVAPETALEFVRARLREVSADR